MSTLQAPLSFALKGDQRVVRSGDREFDSIPALVAGVPELRGPDGLASYCNAVNHLARGDDYRLIADPAAYRAEYERRFEAEDPATPFREGVARLRDFGHSRLDEIAPPSVNGGTVVFYVEDDYLGIPYRVTAPGPARPEGDVSYEPLPVSPG